MKWSLVIHPLFVPDLFITVIAIESSQKMLLLSILVICIDFLWNLWTGRPWSFDGWQSKSSLTSKSNFFMHTYLPTIMSTVPEEDQEIGWTMMNKCCCFFNTISIFKFRWPWLKRTRLYYIKFFLFQTWHFFILVSGHI